jgi:hypothetical protein
MDKQAARYLPLESSLTTAQIYDKPIRKIRTPKSCVFAKSSLSFSQICGDDEKALQYETVGGLYTTNLGNKMAGFKGMDCELLRLIGDICG